MFARYHEIILSRLTVMKLHISYLNCIHDIMKINALCNSRMMECDPPSNSIYIVPNASQILPYCVVHLKEGMYMDIVVSYRQSKKPMPAKVAPPLVPPPVSSSSPQPTVILPLPSCPPNQALAENVFLLPVSRPHNSIFGRR